MSENTLILDKILEKTPYNSDLNEFQLQFQGFINELIDNQSNPIQDQKKNIKIINKLTLYNPNLSQISERWNDNYQINSIFGKTEYFVNNRQQKTEKKYNLELNNSLNDSISVQISDVLKETENNHNLLESIGQCCCPNCHNNPLFQDLETEIITSNNVEQPVNSQILETPPIDGILSGYKWTLPTDRTLTYSFYEDDVFNGLYYGGETGVREVSEAVKNNVRSIIDWISNVIDINFVEVQETDTNTFGTLRFMLSDNPSYAYGYYPSTHVIGGDIHLNPNYDRLEDSNGFQHSAGKHGYMSLIHEIGHTLGLKHPQDATPNLPPELDNTTHTVMSYRLAGYSAGTLMPFDITALQSLYGVKAYHQGNDTYQFFDRIDQFSVNGELSLNTPYLTKQTIWDSNGIDAIDLSQLSGNTLGYHLDINPGGILTTQKAYNETPYLVNGETYYTTTYGTAIAYDVLIENVVNSSSNDEIFLNNAANTISGYSPSTVTGDDVIWFSHYSDTIDLSFYNPAEVSQTQNGNDLVLGLGSNGSITVKDYYVGEQLSIRYADTLSIFIDDVSVLEENNGTTEMIFTVNLSGDSLDVITVDYVISGQTATLGSDFTGITTGTLTFAPTDSQETITVQVNGDVDFEGDETFSITLMNVTGNATILDGTAIGTIVNDDSSPVLSIADFSVSEGGMANATVTLSTPITQTVTVDYTTSNGTAIAGQDYVAQSGSLTFNAGQTEKIISFSIMDDTIYESGNESFWVNLSNSQNATIGDGQGMGTIIDNDLQPTITVADVSFVEGSQNKGNSTTSVSMIVSLSSVSNEMITVQYGTSDGTAIAGTDYIATSGTLMFNPGDIQQTVDLEVFSDKDGELDETFLLQFFNATGANLGDTEAIVTILDDDSSTGGGGKGGGKGNNTIPSQTKPLNILPNQDILTGEDSLMVGSSETLTSQSSELLVLEEEIQSFNHKIDDYGFLESNYALGSGQIINSLDNQHLLFNSGLSINNVSSVFPDSLISP